MGRDDGEHHERGEETSEWHTLIYAIWNIWKERNRRIFNGTCLTHFEVAALGLEDIKQRDMAFGRDHDTEGIG